MKQIQWYPGHMSKAKREIEAKLKLVDVIVELLDARIPYSSANPLIGGLIKNKPKLVILNKASLADPNQTAKWLKHFEKEGIKALDIDLKTKRNVQKIIPAIEDLMKTKKELLKAKGIIKNNIRIMILGIPNVGKSTLINTLAKKRSAQVGDKPGVTKGQMWIKLSDSIELLDTPGILWPKFQESDVAFNLAVCGAIKDDILPLEEVVMYALGFMLKYYPSALETRYEIKIDDEEELNSILIKIAQRRQAFEKGGNIDFERVIHLILHDIRNNKLGVMSYDRKI